MRKITVFEKGRSCRLWHRWQHVLDNGYTKYFECKDCGARQSRQPEGGYQPVDVDWLTRGRPPTADDIKSMKVGGFFSPLFSPLTKKKGASRS